MQQFGLDIRFSSLLDSTVGGCRFCPENLLDILGTACCETRTCLLKQLALCPWRVQDHTSDSRYGSQGQITVFGGDTLHISCRIVKGFNPNFFSTMAFLDSISDENPSREQIFSKDRAYHFVGGHAALSPGITEDGLGWNSMENTPDLMEGTAMLWKKGLSFRSDEKSLSIWACFRLWWPEAVARFFILSPERP